MLTTTIDHVVPTIMFRSTLCFYINRKQIFGALETEQL